MTKGSGLCGRRGLSGEEGERWSESSLRRACGASGFSPVCPRPPASRVSGFPRQPFWGGAPRLCGRSQSRRGRCELPGKTRPSCTGLSICCCRTAGAPRPNRSPGNLSCDERVYTNHTPAERNNTPEIRPIIINYEFKLIFAFVPLL